MKLSLPSKRVTGILAAAFAAGVTGIATFNKTDPDEFGLRETGYAVIADNFLKPGIHVQIPFVQYTHNYKVNTQKIAFNAGGCRFKPFCDSTADQNPLRAEIVLSYRVKPDLQNMGYHRWEMEGIVMQDGYWLLTDMINTSANAVLGKKNMAQNLADPETFLKEFHEDLVNRIGQNNIPIEVESIELKSLNTTYMPTRNMTYGAVRHTTGMPVGPAPASQIK